jgi:hypothetical protein
MTLDELLEQLTELVDTHEQGKGTRGDDNFDCEACVDCRHCRFCVRCEACDDCTYGEDLFDCLRCTQSKRSVSCVDSSYLEDCRDVRKSKYLMLSVDCEDCTHCLGCVGLNKAEFHVLNRPVTRKEYFATLKQVKEAMEARLVEGWLPDVIGLLVGREEEGAEDDRHDDVAATGTPTPQAYVDTPVVPWSISAQTIAPAEVARAVVDDPDDPVVAARRLIAERAAREDALREAARRERDDAATRAREQDELAARERERLAELARTRGAEPRGGEVAGRERGRVDDWRMTSGGAGAARDAGDGRRREGIDAPPTFARGGSEGTGSSPGTRLPGSRSPTLRGATLLAPADDDWRAEDPWRDAELPPMANAGAPDPMEAYESEPIDLRDDPGAARGRGAGSVSDGRREPSPNARLTRAARPAAPIDERREDSSNSHAAASSASLRRATRPSVDEPASPGSLTRARKPPR